MLESQLIKRWREEGELKSARRAVVRVLACRFPNQVPTEVLETIEQQSSLMMLEDWHTQALAATSLDEFIKLLRR